MLAAQAQAGAADDAAAGAAADAPTRPPTRPPRPRRRRARAPRARTRRRARRRRRAERDEALDGVDQWAALVAGERSARRHIAHNINSDLFGSAGALRIGEYKLIVEARVSESEIYEYGQHMLQDDDWDLKELSQVIHQKLLRSPGDQHLYNVAKNPSELDTRECDELEACANLYDDPLFAEVQAMMLDKWAELESLNPDSNELWLDDGPLADPANFGGVWTPWRDEAGVPTRCTSRRRDAPRPARRLELLKPAVAAGRGDGRARRRRREGARGRGGRDRARAAGGRDRRRRRRRVRRRGGRRRAPARGPSAEPPTTRARTRRARARVFMASSARSAARPARRSCCGNRADTRRSESRRARARKPRARAS